MSLKDLFEQMEEAKRQKLRDRGWKQIGNFGHTYWEHPESRALYRELDAFATLEKIEAQEQKGGTE